MTTATTTTTTRARRTATINLPLVTAEFRAPRMPHVPRPRVSMPHVPVPRPSMPHVTAPHLPSRREIIDLGHGVSGFLPPRDQLALYGGLGAAAALGLLDWPVAIAVGAATAVARHRSGLPVLIAGQPPAPTATPVPAEPATRRTTVKKPAARKTTAKKSVVTKSA